MSQTHEFPYLRLFRNGGIVAPPPRTRDQPDAEWERKIPPWSQVSERGVPQPLDARHALMTALLDRPKRAQEAPKHVQGLLSPR